tara:strand:+ start:151 stop:759 length:609 start_codon:yes stop_codon:yes gene_type:complete
VAEHFWSIQQSQPKRQFRWVMNIGGIPQWIVKKVAKPSFSVSEGKHVYLNHTFYYPGRVEYEKTDITLVDPAGPDATAMMWDLLYHSGYGIPDEPGDVVTMNKKSSVQSLGKVSVSQLDGEGDIIEQFSFQNPWIAGVKFGELDYESDNLVDITLSLRYDFVIVDSILDTDWKKYTKASAESTPPVIVGSAGRTHPIIGGGD